MAKKEIRPISIPDLIVERYNTEEVVAFLTTKLKNYNNRMGAEYADRELTIYLSILDALNKKLGGGAGPTIL